MSRMHNPPHPGEVIKELCLDPLKLTVTAAAEGLGVSRRTLSSSARGRRQKVLHFGRAGSLLGLPQIILQLQLQPAFRGTAKPLRQPNCHVGRNPGMTV